MQIINIHKSNSWVSSSINPRNNYKGRLGSKTKCCRHVYGWVFHDNYIQQLLKGKDGIVMKRSLYHLINILQANNWVLIIRNNKCFIIIFSLPNYSLKVFFRAWIWARYKPIKRHTHRVQALDDWCPVTCVQVQCCIKSVL